MIDNPDDIPGSLEKLAADIRSGAVKTKAVVVVVRLRTKPEVFGLGNNMGAVKAAGLLELATQELMA